MTSKEGKMDPDAMDIDGAIGWVQSIIDVPGTEESIVEVLIPDRGEIVTVSSNDLEEIRDD